jgi:hypothetical protein
MKDIHCIRVGLHLVDFLCPVKSQASTSAREIRLCGLGSCVQLGITLKASS